MTIVVALFSQKFKREQKVFRWPLRASPPAAANDKASSWKDDRSLCEATKAKRSFLSAVRQTENLKEDEEEAADNGRTDSVSP